MDPLEKLYAPHRNTPPPRRRRAGRDLVAYEWSAVTGGAVLTYETRDSHGVLEKREQIGRFQPNWRSNDQA